MMFMKDSEIQVFLSNLPTHEFTICQHAFLVKEYLPSKDTNCDIILTDPLYYCKDYFYVDSRNGKVYLRYFEYKDFGPDGEWKIEFVCTGTDVFLVSLMVYEIYYKRMRRLSLYGFFVTNSTKYAFALESILASVVRDYPNSEFWKRIINYVRDGIAPAQNI